MSLGVRKTPRQTRSRATVDAILDATIRVLLSRGYQGTTTIAVAERAGVSVGSLYQYFPHKDSIIAALLKRHMADVMRCVDEALRTADGNDRERAIRAIVQAGIAAHRIHPALHKVMVEQVPRIGQMKAAMNTSRLVTRRLADWFDAHPRLGIVDAERTAFVVETLVEALTHRVIVDKAAGMSERDLEDETTRILLAYIDRG
jgi:AcrR family transcriptional regulator